MTMTTTMDSRLERDADGTPRVRYWSVYDQVWAYAYARSDVSDAEHAAQDTATRALLATLPTEEE